MIPKKIHYCWFGGNPLSNLAQNCIASWKKHCPNYEYILWNEDNFNVNAIRYTKIAAKEKKWAFVSDYVRAYVIFNFGGIYLDTDVELCRPLDDLLDKSKCFGGFEDNGFVNPGLIFAGEKGSIISKELMDIYASYRLKKIKGTFNFIPIPEIFSKLLLKHGLKQNNVHQELDAFTVYPTEYFCPKSLHTGLLSITDNTYSIHHFNGSWTTERRQNIIQERWHFYEKYGNDSYLVEMFENINHYKKQSIDLVSLKKLYKTAIKRTIKRIIALFCKKNHEKS